MFFTLSKGFVKLVFSKFKSNKINVKKIEILVKSNWNSVTSIMSNAIKEWPVSENDYVFLNE